MSGHVQVLHDLAARMVSAVMQAKAMDGIEPQLTEAEAVVVRRGRNTKSTVPKARLSASTGKGRLLKPSWDGSTLQGKRRALKY